MSVKTKNSHINSWILALISGFIGISFCGAALALFSWILLKSGLSASLSAGFSTASLGIGCFFTAFTASRIRRRRGLLCGLYSLLFFTVLAAVCAGIWGNRTLTIITPIRLGVLCLCGCLGGLLGMREKQHKGS